MQYPVPEDSLCGKKASKPVGYSGERFKRRGQKGRGLASCTDLSNTRQRAGNPPWVSQMQARAAVTFVRVSKRCWCFSTRECISFPYNTIFAGKASRW